MACKAGAPTDRAVVKSEDGRLYRNAGVRTETPLDLRQRGMKSDLCRVFAGASENAPFLLKQAEHRHVHCVGRAPRSAHFLAQAAPDNMAAAHSRGLSKLDGLPREWHLIKPAQSRPSGALSAPVTMVVILRFGDGHDLAGRRIEEDLGRFTVTAMVEVE